MTTLKEIQADLRKARRDALECDDTGESAYLLSVAASKAAEAMEMHILLGDAREVWNASRNVIETVMFMHNNSNMGLADSKELFDQKVRR